MVCLDLEHLPKKTFLSYNRFNLFSIDDRDHIDQGIPGGIRANLLAWLETQEVTVPSDVQVRLVTFPRVLGYAFNPVSFYYLDSADGEPLFAVAEVGNTYREMKLFIVNNKKGKSFQRTVQKEFYVSPFSDVRDDFDFRLGQPGDMLGVTINNLHQGKISLTSSVVGKASSLTSTRLLWFSVKYPLLSLKIIVMIHWQAFLLWIRKVPYFKKADQTESQTEVLKPHSSLKKPSAPNE